MKMHRFTKLNGDFAYIRDSAITAVSKRDGKTVIYIVGDFQPFEVKESVEEVLNEIVSD